MAFPAFLDTCTLFGYHLCDLILRLAEAETFRPVWSDDVLDELRRNLVGQVGLTEPQARHRGPDLLDRLAKAGVPDFAAAAAALLRASQADE